MPGAIPSAATWIERRSACRFATGDPSLVSASAAETAHPRLSAGWRSRRRSSDPRGVGLLGPGAFPPTEPVGNARCWFIPRSSNSHQTEHFPNRLDRAGRLDETIVTLRRPTVVRKRLASVAKGFRSRRRESSSCRSTVCPVAPRCRQQRMLGRRHVRRNQRVSTAHCEAVAGGISGQGKILESRGADGAIVAAFPLAKSGWRFYGFDRRRGQADHCQGAEESRSSTLPRNRRCKASASNRWT